MSHDSRTNTANFVHNVINNKGLSRQNVRAAFASIADLVTSRNQDDVDSGFDTLYILVRALEVEKPPA